MDDFDLDPKVTKATGDLAQPRQNESYTTEWTAA
jgi:hypothetical protein